MELLTPFTWALALAIALLAGVVKGSVGFALPLVMISALSNFLDPRLALAGIMIPILATNSWQVFRQGTAPAREAVQGNWRFILVVCIFIALSAQLVTKMERETFYLILGVPIVALSVIQLLGVRLHIPPARRTIAEWGFGALTGVLGGLSGTWGATTVLYLMAIDTPKLRQIVVQGVIFGVGSVVLVASHIRSGILNADTVWFSAALLPPALVGLWLGFQLQDRMDQALFRKITLVVIVVGGLNLIRKGLLGG